MKGLFATGFCWDRLRPKDGDTTKSGVQDVSWKTVQGKAYGLDLGAHFGLKGDALKYKLVYAVTSLYRTPTLRLRAYASAAPI